MKKSLVSLVAAAALLGSVSIASAGTVTTKGDTNITLGGFVNEFFIWGNNLSNADPFTTAANGPSFDTTNGFSKPKAAQTNLTTTAAWTRLNLGISNKAEGITGLINADFFSGSLGYGGSSAGLRLREAYFKKTFGDSGNFQPWLLIGQTWALGTYDNGYTLNPVSGTAGAVGGYDRPRVPQVTFGLNMDFGSVKINPQLGFEDLIYGVQEVSGDGVEGYNNSGWTTTKGVTVRAQMPGIGLNVPITFNTGLGDPATFTAAGEIQPVKVSYAGANNLSTEKTKTSWEIGAGLDLPIYFVSLTGHVAYSSGFALYNSFVTGYNPIPASYWLDQNKDLQTTRATQWDVGLKVDFNKLAQVPVSLAGGYSQQIFSNYNNVNTVNYNKVTMLGDYATSTKASTIYANITYNLSKSILLGLEYDRDKTYFANDPSTAYNGNAVIFMGQYNF